MLLLNQLIERRKVTARKENRIPLHWDLASTSQITCLSWITKRGEGGMIRESHLMNRSIWILPHRFSITGGVFEGLKAYRSEDGRVLMFRPDQNIKRLNKSLRRMSMPPLDEKLALEALIQLVELEQEWIPIEKEPLYISVRL